MANTIKINDGTKVYDIVNQDGKVLGSFSFNPSDTNILKRHAEVVAALESLNLDEYINSGMAIDEVYAELEKIVHEKLNYLLNADVADDFFSIMGAFSPLASGQFFVESVFDAIGQAIQAETGERVKKINNKIQKHTRKYNG